METITLNLQTLMELCSSAVDAGVQEYRRSIEPEQDYVKKAEMKRYVSRMGFKPCIIDKWIADGLLKERQDSGKNTSCLFSFADAKKLLMSVRLKNIVNENLFVSEDK